MEQAALRLSRTRSPRRRLAGKPSSLRPVDPTSLALDDALADIPAQFVKDVLRDIAPRLLAGINCTSLDPAATPAPDKQLPSRARCIFDPSLAPGAAPLPPTFLLALTFPARDPARSPPTRILVPCHSLLYALSSTLFPLAATAPGGVDGGATSFDPAAPPPPGRSTSSLVLPVLGPLELPSVHAFSTLHTFLHTRSTPALRHSLTTKVPSTSRLPSPPPSPRIGASPDRRRRPALAREDAVELLDKIDDVRETAVRLAVADAELWHVMQECFDEVAAEIP
ncbi:hypothetical protein JCM11491_003141 [Sporobolomyces phaffii]